MHVLTLECLVPDCLFAHNIKGYLELAMGGLKSPAGWTEKGLIQRWSVSQGCGFPGPSWRLSCKLQQRDKQGNASGWLCATGSVRQPWESKCESLLSPGRQCTAALIQRKWEARKSSGCSCIQKLKYFCQKMALQTLPHLLFPTYHQQITEGRGKQSVLQEDVVLPHPIPSKDN